MLSHFDWLRRASTGAELLATLQYLAGDAETLTEDEPREVILSASSLPIDEELGSPPSALDGPCGRCWVYPRAPQLLYCPTCQTILADADRWQKITARAVIVWGYVNQVPSRVRARTDENATRVMARYLHDEQHFLVMLRHRDLQPWLKELVLYHGGTLKGLLQVCPTTGGRDSHMGELLCRLIRNEARFPLDRLRIRFFAVPHQVYDPHTYDRMGILTFDIAEFLRMLDMAVVFRSLLPPEEQKILYHLLKNEDSNEAQFYWGRLLNLLSREAKDMLNAWRIRQWPQPQIDLLYDLVRYVEFYQVN
ncbi:MAG: hypothetical protein N2559_00755 [Anaerolineae bacterium]|nr:hypothetical protein [Anaerolineae bacterium]